MMEASFHNGNDVVAYFWNAYFEWRAQYSLEDNCMLELVAAIRAEIDAGVVSGDEAARLKKLARMIEVELANSRACHAA